MAPDLTQNKNTFRAPTALAWVSFFSSNNHISFRKCWTSLRFIFYHPDRQKRLCQIHPQHVHFHQNRFKSVAEFCAPQGQRTRGGNRQVLSQVFPALAGCCIALTWTSFPQVLYSPKKKWWISLTLSGSYSLLTHPKVTTKDQFWRERWVERGNSKAPIL